MKAAILFETKQPLRVEEVQLDPPGNGEVLVKIAAAVTRDPSIAQKLKRLWIMGGGVGNITPAAEFNFYVDPEAAKIVFKAGFPITLFTWTLTLSHGVFFDDDLARIETVETPFRRVYREVSSSDARVLTGRTASRAYPDAGVKEKVDEAADKVKDAVNRGD